MTIIEDKMSSVLYYCGGCFVAFTAYKGTFSVICSAEML